MKSTTINSATLLASTLTTLLFIGAPSTTHASTKHTNPMKLPLPPRRKIPYLRNSDIEELINTASKNDPKHTLTSDSTNWMSVNENVEFLPLLNNKSVVQRRMEDAGQDGNDDAYTATTGTTTGAHDNSDPYSHQPFIEGLGDYDEMAQAWRMLGLMVDCQHKAVEDDDYHQSGSGDQGTDDGCSRWILWAAYVDLDYSGGGVNEYQYYDKDSGKWDKSHCTGDRCAKMDCHLENTHFSVLGFFKHRKLDFNEQLFKHQGYCTWEEEDYEFMQNARRTWPKGCINTYETNSKGESLYYDIKPTQNGGMGLALYTDTYCLNEYTDDPDKVEDVIGNIVGSGKQSRHSQDEEEEEEVEETDYSSESLSTSLNRWDSAFDVWHICHSCVAHDLNNPDGDKFECQNNYDDGYNYWYNYNYGGDDDYNKQNMQQYYAANADDAAGNDDAYYQRVRKLDKKRKLGGEYCQAGAYACYDDAGYTNVNQCMKFSAKTVMKTATFQDLTEAHNQGTLAKFPLAGYINQSAKYRKHSMGNAFTYTFLSASIVLFCFSVYKLKTVVSGSRVMPTLRAHLLDQR